MQSSPAFQNYKVAVRRELVFDECGGEIQGAAVAAP